LASKPRILAVRRTIETPEITSDATSETEFEFDRSCGQECVEVEQCGFTFGMHLDATPEDALSEGHPGARQGEVCRMQLDLANAPCQSKGVERVTAEGRGSRIKAEMKVDCRRAYVSRQTDRPPSPGLLSRGQEGPVLVV
jgi:hypothetical protein